MKKLALLLFVAILLTACQPATPPPPTATAAPIESLASSTSDLVGVWWFSTVKIEFKADGTTRVFLGSGASQETVDEGTYTFEAGKVTWFTASGTCKNQTVTYEAYVTKQDGKPVSLRMQVVGNDPCKDRVDTLKHLGKWIQP